MKINRSYILGLGSGLILSALLALILPPVSLKDSSNLPEKSPSSSLSSGSELAAPNSSGSQNQSIPLDTKETATSESAKVTKQTFTIPPGSSAEKIGELLAAQNLISDKAQFKEYVEKHGLAGKFRAGTYELTTGLPLPELVDKLLNK